MTTPRPTVSKLVDDIASGDILVNWANEEPTYHTVASTENWGRWGKALYVSPDLPSGRNCVRLHRQDTLMVFVKEPEKS